MVKVYYHIEEPGRQELETLANAFYSILNYQREEDSEENKIRRVK